MRRVVVKVGSEVRGVVVTVGSEGEGCGGKSEE